MLWLNLDGISGCVDKHVGLSGEASALREAAHSL